MATLLGAVIVMGGALPAQAAEPLREFHQQQPDWKPCAFDAAAECASIAVPMDYGRPGAERISIALSRIRATDPARRRGVLLSNPGGPGGDGLELPKAFASTPLAAAYDLIGFDPRGVGKSTELSCEDTVAPPKVGSRPGDAELPRLVEFARAVEAACAKAGGELRRHVNTANTARDMDVIRAALGEKKINYLGFSYGTYLGAVYGSLFPAALDRSVLDSAVHPDWIWREQFKHQAIAVRTSVDAWAEWVGKRHDSFGLGRSQAEVVASLERVSARLAVKPVDGLTQTIFDRVMGTLRFRASWKEFAEIIKAVDEALARPERAVDASRALNLFLQAGITPTYQGVFEAVTCEADWPTDTARYLGEMREFREKYPYGNGISSAAPFPCTFRSFTPKEQPVRLQRKGYQAGLVVQAEADAQTHYDGGPALAERLSHHLVSVADDGMHGLYLSNPCVDQHINRYLLDGVLPPSRSVCAGEPRPEVSEDGTDVRYAPTKSLEAAARELIAEGKVASRPF
ncbi:alpha/beta hydrolase [Allokutzneria sp. A3M-2-11 16]|uniref:alpha/beta fold hydrolase n=1 Tax=Allokutzneria sp. A3M-2-11 16 TaxID=2962043 RepID=UPI0020B69AA3|nr:alpha/beta fold hydrolase [Allokutzneria sp. A3M-2-11 16]MCP3799380.1 alpha/beta hydrolase [Allokutzneria sp. A3M-2-11 16]